MTAYVCRGAPEGWYEGIPCPNCEEVSEPVDCRSEVGITIGLVDALISICRVLAKRDLSPTPVREALADLRADEDLDHIRTYGRES